MTPLHRATLLLLPLVLPGLAPERAPVAAQERTPVRFPAMVEPRNDIRLENRVPIRMRDGVVLYADVYRPADDGRYPVIVSRTPYSTERFPSAYASAVYFARRGYVYVFQDAGVRRDEPSRGIRHGAAQEPHGDRPVGTRVVTEVR